MCRRGGESRFQQHFKHMKLSLFVFLLLIVSSCYSQKNKKGREEAERGFSMEIFDANLELAKWLNEYEKVASLAADTIMSKANEDEVYRLGKDWFCFKDTTGTWHAIYGKYYLGEFDQVFHLIFDSSYKIKRSASLADTSLVNTHARALRTAAVAYREADDSSGIYFNRYVRKWDDGMMTVYMLPVLQPNGNAVYGRYYIFHTDPQGVDVKIMETGRAPIITYNVNVPREIWINNLKHAEPTLNSLFFAWYYRAYFKRINIESRNMISTLAKEETGSYGWVHRVPPPDDKKKKK
jgi:hypothetical protein